MHSMTRGEDRGAEGQFGWSIDVHLFRAGHSSLRW